jgi:hypothetical protein
MRDPMSPTEPRRSPGPLSSSWVRFGLLVCFLGALFAVVLFEIPVAGTFADRPGGVAPRAGADARCLRLTYNPPDKYRWMPTAVRLHPEVDRAYAAIEQTWYRADADREDGFYQWLAWRPAGRDSVDIVWHHSPVLRLPTRGTSLVGRGGWPDHASIFSLPLNPDFTVRAHEIACSATEWEPSA